MWAMEAARMTYYGGWFETFVNGVIPGTSYAYDINSAYPYAISTLPCLLHCGAAFLKLDAAQSA